MKVAYRNGAVLLGAGMLAIACSASTSQPGKGGSGQATQTVGPSGGTVTADDGTQLVIPPGALAKDVTITIALNEQAPPLTQAQPLATAHVFGPEGQQFLKPISVTLAFENLPSSVPESAVVVYTAPQGSSAYVPLPTSVADATHVTAQTTHFSNMCPGYGSGNGGAVQADGGGGVPDSGHGPTTCNVPCYADASAGDPNIGLDCSASVNGHAYAANCACDTTTNTGSCTCTVDGVTMNTVNNVSCGGTQNPYETACNFPCPSGSGGGGDGGGGSHDAGSACTLACGIDAGTGQSDYAEYCGANCNGHQYEMNCDCPSSGGTGSCVCLEDGNQTTTTTATCTQAGTQDAFNNGCGFPGTFGGSSGGGDASADDASVDASVDAGSCPGVLCGPLCCPQGSTCQYDAGNPFCG